MAEGKTRIDMSEAKFDYTGEGTPIELDKLKSLVVKGDRYKPGNFTPGWTVKEPDGYVVDACDSPIAAEIRLNPELGL